MTKGATMDPHHTTARMADTIRYLHEGHARGKLVIAV